MTQAEPPVPAPAIQSTPVPATPPGLPRRQAAGLALGALALAAAAQPAAAQVAAPAATPAGGAQQVPGGISYRLIGRWDTARLNRILTTDTPAFSGFQVTYTPARTGVRLYRISYPTFSPERRMGSTALA